MRSLTVKPTDQTSKLCTLRRRAASAGVALGSSHQINDELCCSIAEPFASLAVQGVGLVVLAAFVRVWRSGVKT